MDYRDAIRAAWEAGDPDLALEIRARHGDTTTCPRCGVDKVEWLGLYKPSSNGDPGKIRSYLVCTPCHSAVVNQQYGQQDPRNR